MTIARQQESISVTFAVKIFAKLLLKEKMAREIRTV